jgi:copper transport protein
VRAAAVTIVILGCLLLFPGVALAHATLVSSDPQPGAELSTAPSTVTMSFSEPLNLRLSTASVTAPDGTKFSDASVSGQQISVPLTTNLPGVYTVDWTTVSTLDGHTIRGSFLFGVGVAPGGGEGSATTGLAASDLFVANLRLFEDLGLLFAVGLLALMVREPLLRVRGRTALRVALALALVAGLGVVVGEGVLASGGWTPSSIASYLTTGVPGTARLVRVGAETVALVAALVGAPTLLVAVPLAVAMVALAASGHAAAVPPGWLGVAVESVHVLAAGVWAGGILALATLRPAEGWRSEEGRHLLDRFSPVAIPAFVLTVAAGGLRAYEELSGFGDLVHTSYGRTLSLKIAAVGAMVVLSVFAWRRLVRSLRTEAVLAVVVVALAALLAAYPLPPGRASEAESATATGPSVDGLPTRGELTLADHAGQFLVGLSVRPARPGPNHVTVFLLPLDGPTGATGVPVTLRVDGGPAAAATTCGDTCRSADVSLEGGDDVEVRVASAQGGTVRFAMPPLPPSDGSALLARAQATMHALETYRQDETLHTGLTTIVARYLFQAPDRARITVAHSSTSVFIGSTRYLQHVPGGPWTIERGSPTYPVPTMVWDPFHPYEDASIVGAGKVNGEPTRIVSFFGASPGLPVWFRLWIARDGRVLRAEMRAQGHFMNERFSAFDRPITISPPR